MHRKTWKRRERQAAKILGGHRVPFSGGLPPTSGLPASDVMGVDGFAFVEVKHRQTWQVQTWIRELEAKDRLGNGWLLVVSVPGKHGQYAVLPLKRLAELAGVDRDGQTRLEGALTPAGREETAPLRPE